MTGARRGRTARRGVGAVRALLVLLAALASASCGDDGLGPNPEDATFAASLGIDLSAMTKLPSGVYILTTTPGTGTATVVTSSKVSAGYSGWLANGRLFDTGTIDARAVTDFVPGFEDGVLGMKVGEVRKIVVPARLGYGEEDYSLIPGNSVLVFEVTLISIL